MGVGWGWGAASWQLSQVDQRGERNQMSSFYFYFKFYINKNLASLKVEFSRRLSVGEVSQSIDCFSRLREGIPSLA